MKKSIFWMFAAILTFCSAMVLSSCSSQEDNPALTPTTPTYEEGKGDLVNVWYSEYEATGTVKDDINQDVPYSSDIERYVFNNDGTGRWSRYFMGDQPNPVETYGGYDDGDFTYSLGENGKVTVVLKKDLETLLPQTRELTYADGQLSYGDITFSADTDDIVKEACEYWDDLDHMTAAEKLEDSNRIYGVGYGYNFILDHSKALSRASIVDQTRILKYKWRKTSGIDADIHEATYTGHSLSELANELSATAHVSGGTFGFKGEVGAAFDAKYKKSSEYEYALNIIDIAMTSVTLEIDLDLIKKNLNGAFRAAVDGTFQSYKGEKGLYNLVRDYGTHLICQAKLGGRVRYSNTVDISKVSGEYDLAAFAKASYTGIGLTASASVDDKFKKSFENNKSAVDTRITAIGGTPATVLDLMEKGNEEKFKAWRETLAQDDYKNTSVVAVEQVIPIWELVRDNPLRAKEIERYIKDGGYERDMTGDNNFLVGAIGKISDVTSIFTKEDEEKGTLVKNLEIDGNIVAQACLEFIPQFNASQRSIVLYPVANNKAKYNLGYFIGNSSLAPCRVCWSMTSAVPSLIPLTREKKIGAKKELYILGSSFLHKDIDKATIEAGQVCPVTAKGFFMETKALNSKGEDEYDHQYPLVKIFNHVWTRENLSSFIDDVTQKTSDNQCLYKNALMSTAAKLKRLPDGWVVPTNETYQQMWDELKNRNINQPGKKMAVGGVIGFNAPWVGWMKEKTLNDKDKKACFWSCKYDTKTKKPDYTTHYCITLDRETGNMSIELNPTTEADKFYYSVRLIQETTW